jgi:hypothetical protein
LWLLYLSLSTVSSDFLSFQWDALLLEAGLIALFIAPLSFWHRPQQHEPRTGARWLVWWLLFRLMLGSGIVKLASGDPTWRDLTALAYHYQTQPIPTPFGWFAQQLPAWWQRTSTALVLGIELGAPWLIWSPRRIRTSVCAAFIGLQILIAATGNYAFFNVLTIALAITLIDDGSWRSLRWARRYMRSEDPRREVSNARRWPRWAVTAAALVVVPVSLVILSGQAGTSVPGSGFIAPVYEAIAPFRSINAYGLFAVMTTARREIIIEGSNDGRTWRAYEFKYKPGDVQRRPPWVAPHQPRLDWQMWFAALGTYQSESWFQEFCRRLLEGSPAVRRLLADDPFPGAPPRYVRGMLYEYRFSDRQTRALSGAWWIREARGAYSPALSLKSRVDPSAPAPDPAPR